MTQTAKQVKHIQSLTWTVPQARMDRELETASFGSPELMAVVQDNFEADNWAEGKYGKI